MHRIHFNLFHVFSSFHPYKMAEKPFEEYFKKTNCLLSVVLYPQIHLMYSNGFFKFMQPGGDFPCGSVCEECFRSQDHIIRRWYMGLERVPENKINNLRDSLKNFMKPSYQRINCDVVSKVLVNFRVHFFALSNWSTRKTENLFYNNFEIEWISKDNWKLKHNNNEENVNW